MHDINIDLREPTLAHMRNRVYDLKAPALVVELIREALDGLERNTAEGDVIVQAGGQLVTTRRADGGTAHTALAVRVYRVPPPLPVVHEDAPEAVAADAGPATDEGSTDGDAGVAATTTDALVFTPRDEERGAAAPVRRRRGARADPG